MKNIVLTIIMSLLLMSCATSGKSSLLGAGVGAVVGGGFGAAAGSSRGKADKGAGIGALVGAAIGGLAGFLKHNEDHSKSGMLIKGVSSDDLNPSMTLPKVRRMWVPDRIEDDKLIRGHFVYIMEEASRWRLEDGKK